MCVCVQGSDKTGGGIPAAHRSLASLFFFTTTIAPEPTYTYSGGFGGSLEGQGLGLAVARAYATLMRGSVSIACMPGLGTDVYVTLSQQA